MSVEAMGDALVQKDDIIKRKSTLGGPDGRRSWFIAVVCFVITTITSIFTRTSGILYQSIVTTYGVSRAEAAQPIAIVQGFLNLSGLISGPLIQAFGVQKVCVFGGLLMCIGIAVSYFANNVAFLVVSLGAVHGIGYGLVYTCTVIVINQYFEKKRGLALGVNLVGATAASLIAPKPMEILLQLIGLRGTFLSLGALLLSVPLLSVVFRKPSWETSSTESAVADILPCTASPTVEAESPKKIEVYTVANHEQNDATTAENASSQTTSMLDGYKTVLTNPRFYLASIPLYLFTFTYEIFFNVMVDYSSDLGLDASVPSNALIFYSITECIGRLGLPLLNDFQIISTSGLMTLSLCFMTAVTVLFALAKTAVTYTAGAALFGLPMGYVVVACSAQLADEVGIQFLPMSFGVAAALLSTASFMRPYLIGYFRDTFHSYSNLFLFLAGLCAIGSIISAGLVTVKVIANNRRRRHLQKRQMEKMYGVENNNIPAFDDEACDYSRSTHDRCDKEKLCNEPTNVSIGVTNVVLVIDESDMKERLN